MTQPRFFQVFSRNNGNPYRLLLVYSDEGLIVGGYEARSSSPNYCRKLREAGLAQLPTVHVAPTEYKALRYACNSVAEVVPVD